VEKEEQNCFQTLFYITYDVWKYFWKMWGCFRNWRDTWFDRV